MPVLSQTSTRPREELALTIVEASGANGNNIWRNLLPLRGINKRNAHLIKAKIAETQALRILTDRYIRVPGTKFERLTAKFADDTLSVILRGVEIVVPNETEMDYDAFLDVEQFFAYRFGQMADDTHEYLTASAIMSTANFGSATNSATAYTVANLATMLPASDITASIRRVKAKGERPDTIAMSGPVYDRIRLSANMLAYCIGQLGAVSEVTDDVIARAFAKQGIKQVLVGDAYINTAADMDTPSLSQIWADTYIWVGKSGMSEIAPVEGVPAQLTGVGANIFWEDYTPEGGVGVVSYEDVPTDSIVQRVKMSTRPYIGNSRAGDLIATQYS